MFAADPSKVSREVLPILRWPRNAWMQQIPSIVNVAADHTGRIFGLCSAFPAILKMTGDTGGLTRRQFTIRVSN